MDNESLGIIEVLGYIAAIEGLDAALKSANVNLLCIEKPGSGIITVIIKGDVGACKASIEAGEVAAKKVGTFRASHIIARPTKEILSMFKSKQIPIQNIIPEKIEIKSNKIENKIEDKIENKIETNSPSEIKTEIIKKDEKKATIIDDNLTQMGVSGLRRLARDLKITNIPVSEIKFARKGMLIEKIREFRKGDN